MIRIFSSTYSVAALATMAMTMTMTYSNGVVSAATMEEAAAAAVNNTEAAANEAVANILNLGAACKPKPFVNVCTASDCICKSTAYSVVFYCVMPREKGRERTVRNVYFLFALLTFIFLLLRYHY